MFNSDQFEAALTDLVDTAHMAGKAEATAEQAEEASVEAAAQATSARTSANNAKAVLDTKIGAIKSLINGQDPQVQATPTDAGEKSAGAVA